MNKQSNLNSKPNSKRNVKKVILQGRNHSYEYEKRFDDKGNNVVVKTVKTIEINRTSKIYRDASPPYKTKGYERPTKASLLKQVGKSTTKFLNKSDEIFNENQKFFEKIEKDITLAMNNTDSAENLTNLSNQCNIDQKCNINSLFNSQNDQKRNVTPSCIKITSACQTERESDNLSRNEKEYFNMPPNGRIYPTKYKTLPKTFISKKNCQPDSFRSDQTWDQSLSRNKRGSHERHKSILKKSNLAENTKNLRKTLDMRQLDVEADSNRLKSGLDEKRNQKCCKFQNCCTDRNSPNAQSTLKSSYCGGSARGSTQSYNYGYRSPISTRNYCPPSQGSRYGSRSPPRHDCSVPKSPPKHDCSVPKSPPKHDCSTPKSPLKSQKSNSSFACRESKPCKSESEILKHLKVSVTMDNDCEELCKRHNLDHVKKNISRYACKNKSDPVKFLVEIEKEFDCKKPELNECAEDMENAEESNSKNNLSDTDRFILKMIKQLIEFKKQSLISREKSQTCLVNKSLSMSQLGKCLQDVQKDGSGLIITLRNAENEKSCDELKMSRKCKDNSSHSNNFLNCKGRNKNVIIESENTAPINSTFGRDCFRVCPTDQMTQTDCSFAMNNSNINDSSKRKRVSYEKLPISKNCTKQFENNKEKLNKFINGECKCRKSCIGRKQCHEAVECNDTNLFSYISDIQPRLAESSVKKSCFARLPDKIQEETNVGSYLSYCKDIEEKGKELQERSSKICNKNNDLLERFNKLESNIRSLCKMVSSINGNNKSMCKTSVETMTDDDTKLCSDTNSNLNSNSNVLASQETFWKEMTSLIDTINSSLNENGKNGNISNETYFDDSRKSFMQVTNQTDSNTKNSKNIKSQSIKGIVKQNSPNSSQDHIAIVTATSINVDAPKTNDCINCDDDNTFDNNCNQFYDAGGESTSGRSKKKCCSLNPDSNKGCCCSSKNKPKKCPARTPKSCLKSNDKENSISNNVKNCADINRNSTYSNNQNDLKLITDQVNNQEFSIQNCEDLLPEEQLQFYRQLGRCGTTYIDYPLDMPNTQIYTGFNDIEYLNGCNTPIYICEVPDPGCSFIVEEPSCTQNNLDNMNNLQDENRIDSKFEDNNYCETVGPLQGNIAEAINNLSSLISELKNFMMDAQARCKQNEEDSYQHFLSQLSLPSSNIRESLRLLQDISRDRSTIISNLHQPNTSQQETSQTFSNLLQNSNQDMMQYSTTDQPRENELMSKQDDNALRSSINLNNSFASEQSRDYPFSTNKMNERPFQVQELKSQITECKITFSTDFSTIYANQVIRFMTTKNFPTNNPRENFQIPELRNQNSFAQSSFDNINSSKSEINSNYQTGLSVSRHLNETNGEIVKHYEDRDPNLHYNLQMDLTFKPDKKVHEDGESSNFLSSTRNSKNSEHLNNKSQNQSVRKKVGAESDISHEQQKNIDKSKTNIKRKCSSIPLLKDKKKCIDESKCSESKYPQTSIQNTTDSEDLEEVKSISFDFWDKNVRNSIDIIKEKFKSNSEIKLMQKNSGTDILKARHSLQDKCDDSSDNSMTHDEKGCDDTNCQCMAEIEERLTNVLNDENFQKKLNPGVSSDRDQILFRRASIQRTPSGNHITEHVFTEREFNSKDSKNSKFKFSKFFSK